MNKRQEIYSLLEEIKAIVDDDIDFDDDRSDHGTEPSQQSDCLWNDRARWQQYKGFLGAIANGAGFKMMLLDEGYVFDENHELCHLLEHEFAGEGYDGGMAVVPESSYNRILIPKTIFQGIVGIIFGVAFYSDAGPICYLDLKKIVLDGGNFTISSA